MSYFKRKLRENRVKLNILGLIILFLITLWGIRNNDKILKKVGYCPCPERYDDTYGGVGILSSVPIQCYLRVFPDGVGTGEYIIIPQIGCTTEQCTRINCEEDCLTIHIEDEDPIHLTVRYDIEEFKFKCEQCSIKEKIVYCEADCTLSN